MFSLRRHAPRGITLIELLVVIAIMTMVAAIAIPRMRPMMENRNVRESARAVNVFLSQARVRAMETGRPCGVLFERAAELNQPNACTVMRQVEIPPPYGGDTTNTRVNLGAPTISVNGDVSVQAQLSAGSTSPGLIRLGDYVQFNYQGPFYRITGANGVDPTTGFIYAAPAVAPDPSGFPLTLETNVGAGGTVPWPAAGLPFKIYRQPSFDSTLGLTGSFASIAPSLELPRGVAVDLQFSGIAAGVEFAVESPSSGGDNTPVIVMFAPNGALDRAYYSYAVEQPVGSGNWVLQYEGFPVTAPVFLLVGRTDRVDTTLLPDDGFNNFQDLNNFWLAIGPQTGLVTAAEPAPVDPTLTLAEQIDASRTFAREAQISKGGR